MQLSPSERVLLHARDFAGNPTLTSGKEELLLQPDTKVALDPLADAVLAAVVLGAEQAGALRLELRQRKALFGLMTTTQLVAVQTGDGSVFPQGSLEQRLASHYENGEREVNDLLHDLMEQDTSAPAVNLTSLVKRGLSERGLLATEERKRLKVFTTSHFVATDETRRAAAANPAADVRAALDACQRQRPEVWKKLEKEITYALSRRREANHSSGSDYD